MIDSTPDSSTIQIPLTRGYVAIVDLIDADLSNFKWISRSSGGSSKYAGRAKPRSKEAPKSNIFHMHRVIMERVLGRFLEPKEYVDHINGDGLDNRRCNLRLASSSENHCNRGAPNSNTSGYKGVSWFKRTSKWFARIQIDNKTINLGYFHNRHDAARAYNEAALKYHGEFARLNVIED